MKHCKECGVPDIIGRDQKWSSNGTIPITGDPNFRMGIVESPVMKEIVSRLEKVVGPSIHNMFMESKRKYARHYIDTLLKGPLGFLVRHSSSGGKKAYQTLLQTSTALGYGHAVLEEYKRKALVHGKIQNPYYTPFFVGDVRGVFESIERIPSKGSWDEHGDYATLDVTNMDGEDKLEKRFQYDDKLRKPGDLKYTPCKTCGLPKELSRFVWDLDKGIILDTKSNERVFIVGLNDFNGVFIELEAAIGEIVPEIILEVNREQGIKIVKDNVITGYGDLVRGAGLKGLAYTTFEGTKEQIKLTFKNTFNKEYVVGRALGVYEGLEGVKPDHTIKESPGIIEVTIKGRGG
jgi:hypothetical protein